MLLFSFCCTECSLNKSFVLLFFHRKRLLGCLDGLHDITPQQNNTVNVKLNKSLYCNAVLLVDNVAANSEYVFKTTLKKKSLQSSCNTFALRMHCTMFSLTQITAYSCMVIFRKTWRTCRFAAVLH